MQGLDEIHEANRRAVIDRPETARALAKAIAYKQCGCDEKAEHWAIRLVQLLQCANILKEV